MFSVKVTSSMNLTDAEAAIMQQALIYFPRGAQQATTALLQEYILGANYTTNPQIAQGVNQVMQHVVFELSKKLVCVYAFLKI